ncbi:hypothetical protein [Pseudomonas indica]|uniref:Phage tail assembly chaperone protein, E, or 41 or 14 n=1 Tax=Pseudomonas indica TaxID=137658 RepID=A0A1G8V5M7_9PSED|nr:hypothetical protein [Pseudomonas indica]SDJ61378.1 hypothetical protein SAMN05216186_102107 [Pseudomonas indica]
MSDASGKAVVTVGKGDSAWDVVVSELTVAQMRQVMLNNPWPGEEASEEDLVHYQLDNFLFEDCRLCDLSVIAGLDKAKLSTLTGSDLRKILAKAKELNPDFFGALGRIQGARKSF